MMMKIQAKNDIKLYWRTEPNNRKLCLFDKQGYNFIIMDTQTHIILLYNCVHIRQISNAIK